METEVLGAVSQFGVAGLIGWMWLSERRNGAERDRQLGEAHRAIEGERFDRQALVELVRDATRAISAIEAGQRALIALLEPIVHGGDRARAGDRAGDRAGNRRGAGGTPGA